MVDVEKLDIPLDLGCCITKGASAIRSLSICRSASAVVLMQ